MISETFFSSHYTSVWRGLAPTMEDFVRENNLRGYQRLYAPLISEVESARRGLVNEAAAILLSRDINWNGVFTIRRRVDLTDVFQEAHRYITGDIKLAKFEAPSDAEVRETRELYSRLRELFGGPAAHLYRPNPPFRGCGLIASCNGDIIGNDGSLYEIKNGERSFRSLDYRQISVYFALYYAQKKVIIPTLSLVNARMGISIKMQSDDFARGVSGLSAADYCQNLIDSFSAALTSN